MENKTIIILLIVIIVVLAAAIGVALFNPTSAKEPATVKITSDASQYECGKLSIKLADLNGTAVSKEIVNITVTNKKGKVVVDDVVKTDNDGKASLDMNLKKGKYVVNVAYGGNENYTGNNTTQKLKIKEEVVEASVVHKDQSEASSTHTIMGEDGYYYTVDDDGNILESLGPSSKYYPDNPNSVNYPDAEPGYLYIDKSQ